MAEIKRLSVIQLFKDAAGYAAKHLRTMSLFTVGHMVFFGGGLILIGQQADSAFLSVFLLYYLFWCLFFRFYFRRKPLLATTKLFVTIVPFTKMVFMASVLASLLYALPLAVPFLGIGQDWAARYEIYLKRYMEDTNVLNVATFAVLILAAPLVFFRPMMAWIASIIGRSGAMGSAFSRTEGNYGKFVLISIIFGTAFALLGVGSGELELGIWPEVVAGSLLTVYLGIVLGKMYEYFFLEIDV